MYLSVSGHYIYLRVSVCIARICHYQSVHGQERHQLGINIHVFSFFLISAIVQWHMCQIWLCRRVLEPQWRERHFEHFILFSPAIPGDHTWFNITSGPNTRMLCPSGRTVDSYRMHRDTYRYIQITLFYLVLIMYLSCMYHACILYSSVFIVDVTCVRHRLPGMGVCLWTALGSRTPWYPQRRAVG